jgi:hypothetical protein
MVGLKMVAVRMPLIGKQAESTPVKSSTGLDVVRTLLARLIDGPPLILGDVDSSVLPRATRELREQHFLLRHGPRQC